MWLLGCCNWLTGYLYAGVSVIGRTGWLVVASILLWCCRWLSGYLYEGVRVVCRKGWLVVARVLLCGSYGVVAGCHGIAMQFLRCCR